MTSIPADINNSLNIFKSLYGFGRKSITKAKTRYSTPLRVQKLADDFFSSNIKVSTTVTVDGFLSKYGFCYKPSTYSTVLLDRSTEKLGAIGFDKNGKLVQKAEMQTKAKLFQFPVQLLPTIEIEKSKFNICFLYPTEFTSFILAENKNKKEKNKSEDHLDIQDRHRGIPVLVPDSDFHNFSESYVTLTGITSLLPHDLCSTFTEKAGETINDFSYHFIRPFSPNMGFCIDCRDDTNSDIVIRSKPDSLFGAVYVESHLEGISGSNFVESIKRSIPNALPLILRWGNESRNFFNVEDDISVVGTDSHSYGFYIETNLVDQVALDKDLKKLVEFYQSFRRNTMNNIRSEHGVEARLKPDFVFDYRRQKLFHPDGVLTSSEATEVIKSDSTLQNVADWMKNEGKI
jgi:hypothetical protein